MPRRIPGRGIPAGGVAPSRSVPAAAPSRRAEARYRRSPHVVAYWQPDGLVLHQFARGTRTVAAPAVVAVLDAAASWRSAEELTAAVPGASRDTLDPLLRSLVRRGLLAASGAPAPDHGR